jgi:hypothetical protein
MGIGTQRTAGAGVARRVAGRLLVLASLPAPIRSIVSTSNGTPAARNARVTTSAGAEGSAPGSLSVTR